MCQKSNNAGFQPAFVCVLTHPPFVTAKKIRIFQIWSYGEGVRLMDTPTLNDRTTVAKRDTAFYILAVLELDDDGVG